MKSMKLIIAIVNNEDSAVVASSLTRENFCVTKLSSQGGFLMTGNVTFLIGAEDGDVPTVKKLIAEYSKTRRHMAHTTGSYGIGLAAGNLPEDAAVKVGGATVFVLGVDSMEKY
jgi:uncharacterized protein YaaQ